MQRKRKVWSFKKKKSIETVPVKKLTTDIPNFKITVLQMLKEKEKRKCRQSQENLIWTKRSINRDIKYEKKSEEKPGAEKAQTLQ